MSKRRITLVNHARTEIACPALVVWQMLLDDYGDGQGFARTGYRLEPIDDPAVFRGYRMRFAGDERVDERICLVTERDDEAMRLSLYAEYLHSPPVTGMVVYATYQAVPTDAGSLYLLDCHSTLDHDVADNMPANAIAGRVAELRDQFDRALTASGVAIRARLEGSEAR